MGHGLGAAEFVQAIIGARRQAIPLPKDTDTSTPCYAEVNHGRWIVNCPFCAGAELADPDDRRFFCLSCYNASVDGKWLTVSWPAERKEIEAELLERPKAENVNWSPGETVASLRAEAAAM